MSDYVASAIASGNTRISRVRTFLAKPPKAATRLRLVGAGAEDSAQVPLGEWEVCEVVPELAAEIIAMLDDHAREMGGHITATLAYCDEGGAVKGALVLKRQANHLEDGLLAPEDMNAQMTGDMRSQAQGAQRHLEVMARVYMAGMAGLLAHSERLVTRQSEMLETLASRVGRAERRADQKDEELEALINALREARDADQAGGGAASPAMERAFGMLERLAPALVAQFMASRAADNTNGQQQAGEGAA